MCGICGWYNKQNHIDGNTLVAMNQIAKYRGPDDEGYSLMSDSRIVNYTGEDSIDLPYMSINTYIPENECFLGFGHRRLSIIDLSAAGHQPMQSEDGRLCITFNGEIYNYVEVRDELMKMGHVFRTSSDTEVLLKAYREWGEDCVLHFNGMWAFAIWDLEKKKIFCSRDRLGVKPFHYYVDDQNFVFGSELKQVIQNPSVPRFLNEEVMTVSMITGLTDYSEDTLIRDVKVLRGGFNLSYELPENRSENPSIRIYPYWDINTKCKKNIDAIEEAFAHQKEAVKIRLRSDVPVGIMLSGGLDSSFLTSEITQLMRGQGVPADSIKTFTSCYEGYSEGDERYFARKVNECCGTSEIFVFPDEEDIFSLFQDMVWHMEETVEFGTIGSFITLREVSKYDSKVILNGQGADETMFGYERYYALYLKYVLKNRGFRAFAKEFIMIVKNSKLRNRSLFGYYFYFSIPAVRRIYCRSRMKKVMNRESIRLFDKNKSINQLISSSSLADLQYSEIRGSQLSRQLHMDERFYMAFSLEARVPFVDYKYIESAILIPEEEKIRNGYTKYLIRERIGDSLPPEVVWRKNKMGWPSPRNRWIERLDKKRVLELFDHPRSEKYFNIAKIKKLWEKNPEAFPVERFINLELFMRLFDVKAS